MTPTIKPCPFCGHDAWLINTLELGATDDPPDCHVSCSHCLAIGPVKEMSVEARDDEIKQAESAAVAAWNRRSRPVIESTCYVNQGSFVFYVAENPPSPTGYSVFHQVTDRKICDTKLLYPHDTQQQIITAAHVALQDIGRDPKGKALLEQLTY